MSDPSRRSFLKGTLLCAASTIAQPWQSLAADTPQLAITIDDPRCSDAPGMSADELNTRILEHLRRAKTKAALFVCGMRVDSEPGRKLLTAWNEAGHILGNHSYSHKYFHSKRLTLAEFEADVEHGEEVVRPYSRFRKLFRFPFFKEGDTTEKRDGMRRWLKTNGYSQGRATIDASDWAIDARLVARLKADPKSDTKAYRDFYLRHIWERAEYYDGLARMTLGHSPRHTLLIHHNLLNALFLGDLLAMLREKGWRLIDAEKAYGDPVYRREPRILPAGESLIWAIAKEQEHPNLRYPGEDSQYEDPQMDRLSL